MSYRNISSRSPRQRIPRSELAAFHRDCRDSSGRTGGKFELVRWTRPGIVLKRRESYYMHDGKQVRDKPYFAQRVRFSILEDANTRLLALKSGGSNPGRRACRPTVANTNLGRRLLSNSTPKWLAPNGPSTFVWNLKKFRSSTTRVRQAMAYAFDEKQMLNDLYYGLYDQCTGNYHADSWCTSKRRRQALSSGFGQSRKPAR